MGTFTERDCLFAQAAVVGDEWQSVFGGERHIGAGVRAAVAAGCPQDFNARCARHQPAGRFAAAILLRQLCSARFWRERGLDKSHNRVLRMRQQQGRHAKAARCIGRYGCGFGDMPAAAAVACARRLLLLITRRTIHILECELQALKSEDGKTRDGSRYFLQQLLAAPQPPGAAASAVPNGHPGGATNGLTARCPAAEVLAGQSDTQHWLRTTARSFRAGKSPFSLRRSTIPLADL